ncbi:hypothetical protein D3C87_637300 [compost metagenome]
MSKKIVVVGGAGQIAAAVAHAMMRAPGSVVVVETDTPAMALDEATMTIGYDPKMIDALAANMSERELYGIELHEAHRLITERRLGDYKIPATDVDMKIEYVDDLPKNAKKPKFLLEQNHRITKVRR